MSAPSPRIPSDVLPMHRVVGRGGVIVALLVSYFLIIAELRAGMLLKDKSSTTRASAVK